jgi:hypothetical protein
VEGPCPLVDSSKDADGDPLTVRGILRAFLPAQEHALELGKRKRRVLWLLAACGTEPPPIWRTRELKLK